MVQPQARVVYWLKQPTPYFVQRCNAIADRGNLRFEAWFNQRREADRSWDVDESSWRFAARYVPRRGVGPLGHRIPIPELLEVRPDVLVQEYDRAYLAAGFLAGSVASRRTAFRVLPNYDAWSDRTWWRELAKNFMFRAVDGAKVPGPDGRRLANRYRLPDSRIWEVRQSIDVTHYAAARAMTDEARERGRRRLGLGGCVFIYVGRLWSGKGIDTLIDAYARTVKRNVDVSLLVVGDGIDEERYRKQTAQLPRVAFAGFVQPSELPELYGLADVMVFPTYGDPNGLVVEEALAASLPVITSDAAGDITRRVLDGVQGFVVAARDSEGLARRMIEVASDNGLLARLRAETGRAVPSVSDDAYAADFEAFVEGLMSTPRRATFSRRASRLLGTALVQAVGIRRHAAPLVGA